MSIGFTENNESKQMTSPGDSSDQSGSKNGSSKTEHSDVVSDLQGMTSSGKTLYVAIAIGILVTIIIVIVLSGSSKAKSDTSSATVTEATVFTEEQVSVDEFVSTETASIELSSQSDYLKSLEGESLMSTYDIADKEYYKDFVNYEMKRASIDDGMEMYWLEITYEGKKYRCQVPYYAAATMDVSGICVVEIEKLLLTSGGSVISYMQVIYNYDEMLKE